MRRGKSMHQRSASCVRFPEPIMGLPRRGLWRTAFKLRGPAPPGTVGVHLVNGREV